MKTQEYDKDKSLYTADFKAGITKILKPRFRLSLKNRSLGLSYLCSIYYVWIKPVFSNPRFNYD